MILAFYLQNKGSYQVVKGTKKKSGGGGGGITAPKTLAPALAEMCIPGWEQPRYTAVTRLASQVFWRGWLIGDWLAYTVFILIRMSSHELIRG